MYFNEFYNKMLEVDNKTILRKDFYDWLDENVITNGYIPIVDKYATIFMIQNRIKSEIEDSIEDSGDIESFYISYDINSTMRILLSYTDIQYSRNDITSKNYDLLFKTGFYNYMMRRCTRDYHNFKEKCDTVVGINSIRIWYDLNKNLMNLPTAQEFDKSVSKVKRMLSNEKFEGQLNNLLKIEAMNNPRMKDLVDLVIDSEKRENDKK